MRLPRSVPLAPLRRAVGAPCAVVAQRRRQDALPGKQTRLPPRPPDRARSPPRPPPPKAPELKPRDTKAKEGVKAGTDQATKQAAAQAVVGEAADPALRTNHVGIQMLPPALHSQLFPPPRRAPHPEQVYTSRKHLRRHGLENRKTSRVPAVDLALPPLLGNSIAEHMHAVGMHEAMPYRAMASRLAGADLPPMPERWSKRPGWTRYLPDGSSQPVEAPLEREIVFDVETVVLEGPLPVMACAASSEAWYGWVSPCLFAEDDAIADLPLRAKLISLGDRRTERLVVGHNVGYDRARTWEEYHLDGTRTRFVDTMSLHSAVGGLSSQQRGIWLAYQKRAAADAAAALAGEEAGAVPELDEGGPPADAEFTLLEGSPSPSDPTLAWIETSAMSSLEWVTNLYLKRKLDKAPRDVFVTGSLEDVREDFQTLFKYCATDVLTTHEVYKVVLPKFLEKCPHPVSFAGMLSMGSAFLPTDSRWKQYGERSEEAYRTRAAEIEATLVRLAETAIRDHMDDGSWKDDPWLRNLDWEPVVPKKATSSPTPKQRATNGKPRWYADLWDAGEKRIRLTTSKRCVPYLLRLQWRGFPLYYCSEIGWTYRVPKEESERAGKGVPVLFTADPDNRPSGHVLDPVAAADTDHIYIRIPHKDGEGNNVGNPLSKAFIQAFEDGVLSSEYPDAKTILRTNAECTYWLGNRMRVAEQFVIRSSVPDADDPSRSELGYPLRPDNQGGAIVPQVVAMGTVTRRAVEKTWMTASNAKKNRIGSELKAQIAAPEGYKIVGADVDSQELWIASLLGDKQVGIHGGTAIGWMTLQGTKAEGTDVHSRTAQILGISRDQAKIFNYSRIYGAGLKHTRQLLMQFNPDIDEAGAMEKASALFASTKGKTSSFELKGQGAGNPFLRKFHFGGTESFLFNQMEEVAADAQPKTPVLGCEIPNALLPENVKNQYLTSRVNWVVQSSGVDYLHMLLASVQYVSKRFGINCRLMITIHDELRFLVTEEDQHRAALALQISNLWVRSMFASACGIDDLPLSVAFFSAVDIDHCLRKEVDMTCVTPSNLEPIPPGVSYDVYQTIDKTGGRLAASEALYRDDSAAVVERCRAALAAVGIEGEDAERAIAELQQVPLAPQSEPDLVLPQDELRGKSRRKTEGRGWSDERVDQFARLVLLPTPPGQADSVHAMTLRDQYWLAAQDAKDVGELVQTIGQYRAVVGKAFKDRIAAISAKALDDKGIAK
ncbi:DNA polymerase gamma, catalytic subunit [Hyaloraphidium curvatum]|nr:DNA polymerase gamma, catalytic subunit [Hyaloraphidium curvatum]